MSGDRRIEVTGSGDAIAGPGGYANTGVHIGDVHVWPGRPVRSGYLHQVRRMAPPELVGRERELAELEAFCTGGSGGYLWWQAPAWSGKTALLAWFALEPPARVRVVSFFVTARLAGQNTRAAFVDHVLEQLTGLLAMPEPAADTARETRLLGLLDTAAHACRGRGETLVLVVDGLDEDAAVVAGAGEDRSIAALLPVALPAGMRVVVSGRPNPPLPDDVPGHHPLRDPGAVRGLDPSAAARVVRDGMEREVTRLLRDPVVGLDLLGLLAASGGGLTGDDLAGLTGLDRAEVGSGCGPSPGGASPGAAAPSGRARRRTSTCSATRSCTWPSWTTWAGGSPTTAGACTRGPTATGSAAGRPTRPSTCWAVTTRCWCPPASSTAPWRCAPTPTARAGCWTCPAATRRRWTRSAR
ncbi:MAG: NACHT domain-containing protein [Saccharothrix sp.]|nr:NACHT domain-containing protein [Saccharothrix sp.]